MEAVRAAAEQRAVTAGPRRRTPSAVPSLVGALRLAAATSGPLPMTIVRWLLPIRPRVTDALLGPHSKILLTVEDGGRPEPPPGEARRAQENTAPRIASGSLAIPARLCASARAATSPNFSSSWTPGLLSSASAVRSSSGNTN